MKHKSIYVAASSQHVGKTTSTLGIVSGLNKAGYNVGYCKPVGQNHLSINGAKVDKDAVLFADLLNFEIVPELHSPVILASGATKNILDDPDQYLKQLDGMILHAKEELSKTADYIIYEGTGHVGVGSVANLSNARVAKMLGAEVIMIVEGGIGSTIDMLNMCLSLFREEGVPILGVLINKVLPEKIEMVEKYVGKWLKTQGINLLGVIPYDKTLGYPLIWTIAKAIEGNFEAFEARGYQKIDKIMAGSLIKNEDFDEGEDILLIVSSRVIDAALDHVIKFHKEKGLEKSPIAGIVVTGDGPLSQISQDFIQENKVPLIRTQLDTYAVVVKFSKLEVKINRKTPWKISKAIELINENVELNFLDS